MGIARSIIIISIIGIKILEYQSFKFFKSKYATTSMASKLSEEASIKDKTKPVINADVFLEDECCIILDQAQDQVTQLIDKLNVVSVLNDPVKLVWETIRFEAQCISKGDLKAATIMASAVLAQPSFQESVIEYVANQMKNPLLPATTIRNLFTEVVQQNPTLPNIWALDIMAASLRDLSRPNAVSVLLFNKGFHSLVVYRVANHLWYSNRDGLARYFQSLCSRNFAADIHPACRIGHSCNIASTTSVVIGETAVVGDDACISHGVTLGGTGKESGDRHPKLGKGVYLGPGSTVLGNIKIGDGVVVDAASVVTKPVPPYCRVSGVPGKVVSTYDVPPSLVEKVERGWGHHLLAGSSNGSLADSAHVSQASTRIDEEVPTIEKICFHGHGIGS